MRHSKKHAKPPNPAEGASTEAPYGRDGGAGAETGRDRASGGGVGDRTSPLKVGRLANWNRPPKCM